MQRLGGAALGLIALLVLPPTAAAQDQPLCACPCPEETAATSPPASAPAASEVPDPSSREALEALAWSHLERGERERAAELADELLAAAPDDANWQRNWIQIVYEAPGRRDEALAAARRLATERPADPGARRLLAQLLSWGDGQEEAMAIYDALISEDPGDVESLKGRAEIAFWDHDALTAERLLRQAAAAAPDDPEISAALERAAPEAAQLRASRTDPTFLLLFGVLVVPTALGFASRNLSSTTWALLFFSVATLIWAAAHLVAPD